LTINIFFIKIVSIARKKSVPFLESVFFLSQKERIRRRGKRDFVIFYKFNLLNYLFNDEQINFFRFKTASMEIFAVPRSLILSRESTLLDFLHNCIHCRYYYHLPC